MTRRKAAGICGVVLTFLAVIIRVTAGATPCEIDGGYNYKNLFTTIWLVDIRSGAHCVTPGAANCSWSFRFCGDDSHQPLCGKDTACETYSPGHYTRFGRFRTLMPNGDNGFLAKFEEPASKELKCSDTSKTLKTHVIFVCDHDKRIPIGPGSVVTSLQYSHIESGDPCQRNLTVPYNGACGHVAAAAQAPSGGLSVGSVLLILFFLGVFLYLVGGIVINRRNGAQGWEVIPHLLFWTALPSLVMEGTIFFFKIITCQATRRPPYEDI